MGEVPLQPTEVVDFIRRRLAWSEAQAENAIQARRAAQVRNIRLFLETQGFPTTATERCRLSLVPLIFQEANYDGIHWSAKMADLEHLADLFTLDFYVASGGLTRSESDEATYQRYIGEAHRCIDVWKA
jgi:hypothetical protein